MVLLKSRCDPADRKALIAVTLSTSPSTLSLSPAASPFHLIIHLRAIESVHPERPITICVSHTVFGHAKGVDTPARGAFGAGLVSTSDPSWTISLGYFMVHDARDENSDSPNLRDRGLEFLTIPAHGEEVVVVHDMPLSRLFKYSSLKKEDLLRGETFKVRMHDGFVGTMWWCWGDVDGNLKEKKLHAWQRGMNLGNAEKPSEEEVEKEGWVLGEDPAELEFIDQSGWVEVEVTE
ncbi:hypothetical protein VTN96DRAFT_2963 [Rasamsonia emersonii]|uniref:Uncharacterized protein n=1 Tax=Rasamsonia emersonii (strain ATCC 16479 / CBS 393.64 / IMI 116815) TaxID=1408163 RepID=A0A0F4YGC5_RASE3|nr:hypothetical protein T310_9374 [Rasamsonia emersonii CBS 393.64]KKA17006.1 hypothetical protein T310_9374 [Rasamsonia emersonii CBS 393.64]